MEIFLIAMGVMIMIPMITAKLILGLSTTQIKDIISKHCDDNGVVDIHSASVEIYLRNWL